MKQQKNTLLDKRIPIFVQTTKVFEKENFQRPERLNKKEFKMQMGKKWDGVHRVCNRCESFQNFFIFDNIVPTLDSFRKFTSIRNIIGSGLKNLFAQLSKTFFENVIFDLIRPIVNFQKHPSKMTRYGVHLPKEYVSSYFVG